MKRHKEIPSRRIVNFRVCLPLQWKRPFILERDATAEGDHAGFEMAISRPRDKYTVVFQYHPQRNRANIHGNG